MKVSAVIPTIKGREALLEQTVQSLAATANGTPVELIVVQDSPTIGEAWNEGVENSTGTHLWLGADDVTFAPGWLEAVDDARERGIYPVPRIIRPDGSVQACGTLGQGGVIEAEVEDGFPCGASQFPVMHRAYWDAIGPALSTHYYSDDYLGFRAKVAGLRVELVRGYTLTHHEGTVGRGRMVARAMQDRNAFLKAITEEHSCLVPS